MDDRLREHLPPLPRYPLGVPHFVPNANRESGGNVESVEPYLVADTFTVRVCWWATPRRLRTRTAPTDPTRGSARFAVDGRAAGRI
jgi:hypothetical protein